MSVYIDAVNIYMVWIYYTVYPIVVPQKFPSKFNMSSIYLPYIGKMPNAVLIRNLFLAEGAEYDNWTQV